MLAFDKPFVALSGRALSVPVVANSSALGDAKEFGIAELNEIAETPFCFLDATGIVLGKDPAFINPDETEATGLKISDCRPGIDQRQAIVKNYFLFAVLVTIVRKLLGDIPNGFQRRDTAELGMAGRDLVV